MYVAFPDLQETTPPQEVLTEDTVELRCFAEGSPLQDVKWEFTDKFGVLQYTLDFIITDRDSKTGMQDITLNQASNVNVSSVGDQYTISPPDESIDTKLYGMLTIKNITAFQAGVYRCTLTNIYHTDSYSTTVDVQRE